MENQQFPTTGPNDTGNLKTKAPQPQDNRKLFKLLAGILVLLLVGTWGYIIYDKSKQTGVVNTLQTQALNADSARTAVEAEYNDALMRMDSLTGSNVQLKGELADKQKSIEDLKTQIRAELSSSKGDLSKAHRLIQELKGKVNDLLAEVEQLKAKNQELTASNQNLTSQRDTLTAKNGQLNRHLEETTSENARIKDEASTLHASAFNVTALNINGSGKEKITDKAKKANALRLTFSLDENRITPSGNKELYVIVTSPDGNVVSIPSAGSGTFNTRTEGQKTFTTKINVDYQQGQTEPVTFIWHQEGKYQVGTYHFEVFQNGYRIGSGSKELKKSGFLGL